LPYFGICAARKRKKHRLIWNFNHHSHQATLSSSLMTQDFALVPVNLQQAQVARLHLPESPSQQWETERNFATLEVERR
jgi:hypothetical protein